MHNCRKKGRKLIMLEKNCVLLESNPLEQKKSNGIYKINIASKFVLPTDGLKQKPKNNNQEAKAVEKLPQERPEV